MLKAYKDKLDETDIAKQFAYLLSYSQALPARLPDFYDYLLTYPNGNQQMWKIRSTGRSEIRIEANPTYRASHRAGETR
jgi:hypothetical protein